MRNNLSMKKFWHFIGVWFLLQLLYISICVNVNAIEDKDKPNVQQKEECFEHVSPALAGFMGLLTPITMFDFFNADFCWHSYDNE